MTTQEMIDAIDVQLSLIIANPKLGVDYKEGDVTVKNSQKVTNLLKLKRQLLEHPDAELSTMTFDFDVSQFGLDLTEYET